MKQLAILCILLAGSAPLMGQEQFTGEEGEVYEVVTRLFDAMRESDSLKLKSVFTDNAQLHTAVTNREGKPVLYEESVQKFANAVGTPHDQVWDEPIWNTTIQIDGLLAQVWTEYAFYLGPDFSHCGVDAFQLFKTDEGWKIFQLTDTRKRNNCDIPEEIKNKKR